MPPVMHALGPLLVVAFGDLPDPVRPITDHRGDFGFWSKDERSSLRWFARQRGAKSQVIYLPIDPATQRERVHNRFAGTPDQTWPMSEEELAQWCACFDEPDEAELQGTMLEDAPQGYASWSAWAASRWPSLPDEYA